MRTILADGRMPDRDELRLLVENEFPDCDIFEAGSLTECLRTLVERHPIRLLVMDLSLPGMNGFQGLGAVRRLFPDTLCILVSACDDREIIAEAMRQGAHGFVPRHLGATAMAKALQRVMAGDLFDPGHMLDHHPAHQLPMGLRAMLTPRELDIMRLLSQGLPNKVIANRLSVSEVTVKSHLGKVFRKLGVQNRLQALRMMVEAEGA